MKSLIILFVLALVSVSFTEKPISEKNNLHLYGDVDEVIDIIVYEKSDNEMSWRLESIQTSRAFYMLDLNPTTSYQVWFKNSSGHTKILYVENGKPGRWETKYNISFDKSLDFLHLVQENNLYKLKMLE